MPGRCLVKLGQRLRGDLELRGAGVLVAALEALEAPGAGDGGDPRPLRERPGGGHLCDRDALAVGHRLDEVYQGEVRLEGLLLEAWERGADVALLELGVTGHLPGQEAASERG